MSVVPKEQTQNGPEFGAPSAEPQPALNPWTSAFMLRAAEFGGCVLHSMTAAIVDSYKKGPRCSSNCYHSKNN